MSSQDMMIQLFELSSRGSAPRIVFVGRNRAGHWVAREQRGAFGGSFVDRAQALKYALHKNGRHPESIIEVTREIELDIRTNPSHAEFDDCGADCWTRCPLCHWTLVKKIE
ncbi:hypothetical protein [Bradyrhizobium elkanii]|uniref:Uncharacterized protein n=1 Tax=Bradyrhizobium elkanii TaxID=29448 RepID=A0A8I1YHU3_BRAEL|nr:hypothetical protein [Bradyrhizobium elkanii]MBP1299772.1 hypothetical protein [Bradyrhizobium elkanii]